MALIRLLDFALLTFLVWLVWSQLIRGWRSAGTPPANAADAADPRRQPSRPPAASAAGTAPEPPLLTLVRCNACGVHVPSARILTGAAGEIFCSDACRARGAASPPV
ncbi:MAG TPA: PP0621 family protein [Thermoanaerobaculia bacterium]